MTNNNNIHDLPKTFTVSYFNGKAWNKDLTPQEIKKREQLAELFYQDNLLNGVKVGPGNSQSSSGWSHPTLSNSSSWGQSRRRSPFDIAGNAADAIVSVAEATPYIVETVTKGAAAAAVTAATGGLAPLAGAGMWIGGQFLKTSNEQFVQFLGSNVGDIGGGVFFGGLFANSKVGEIATQSGVDLKKLEQIYEVEGKVETVWEIAKHKEHKDRGKSYDSGCEICRK